MPSSFEGLRRLDRGTGLEHRPASAMADEMATNRGDPWSIALWRAHVERAIRAARAFKAGIPKPRLLVRDPYAIRALILGLGVAAFFPPRGRPVEANTA